jgi:DNA-binding transcriptional LysR family regulator
VEFPERILRVRAVWNWIPAFRAVAETQHIHQASRLLRVSPSALSRAIRLLEDQVGEPLFERTGRTLRLNAVGEEFLAVIRDAMRRVDDGLSQLASGELVGPVLLMSASALSDAYLLPALRELCRAHPKLIPHIHRFSRDETVHRLLRGQLDVALFQGAAPAHPRLVEEQIGSLTNGVYCGPSHPLFRSAQAGLAQLLEHPFAAIVAPETQIVQDGWLPEQPRRIGMYLSDFSLAYEVCAGGQMLAILPDVLVESRGWGDRLHRLGTEVVSNSPLCTARRPSLSKRSPAEAVVDALRRAVQEQQAIFFSTPPVTAANAQ